MSKSVFISYPEKDRRLAEKLMKSLQAEGISTTWPDKVMEAGTSLPQRLEAAIEAAQAIVVLVDSKHESGRQQRFEWMMALEATWKNPDKKLIPLLLRNAEAPAFLADKQAIRIDDLSKEWDQAVQILIRILKDEQIEPEPLDSVKPANYSEWRDRLKYIAEQAGLLKQREIDDLKQQRELLTEKLSGLNRQEILKSGVDEKLRLEELINHTQTQRDRVERQLKGMESEFVGVDSNSEAVTGRK